MDITHCVVEDCEDDIELIVDRVLNSIDLDKLVDEVLKRLLVSSEN
jgi:hypothetical protein